MGSSAEMPQQHSTLWLPAVCQEDQPTFSGMEVEDINDWLNSFERVSHHNNWDATTKLNDVVSYPVCGRGMVP